MNTPRSTVLFRDTPVFVSLLLVSLLLVSPLLVSPLLPPIVHSFPLGSGSLPGLASLLSLGRAVVKEHTPVLAVENTGVSIPARLLAVIIVFLQPLPQTLVFCEVHCTEMIHHVVMVPKCDIAGCTLESHVFLLYVLI